MRLRFTKMQGAGNDFVVLDATAGADRTLGANSVRRLGDRRFGVGADQILVVEPPRRAGVDFRYRIFNSTGDEVEHCGNGARCFVRFVRDHGLTDKTTIRVETMNKRARAASCSPTAASRWTCSAPVVRARGACRSMPAA